LRGGIFSRNKATLKAATNVSFELKRGKTLGLVGESGCGKTSVGRALLRLVKATAGEVRFENTSVLDLDKSALQVMRKNMQMIFQDPYESLNQRHTIGQILAEPFLTHTKLRRKEREQKIISLLERVGLKSDALTRYPHEFSGGQRQRISIARAIALDPKLIVCDEAVSALDVSIQAQVMNLLMDLQKELGLSYVFIAHNLAVVRIMSDDVAVMYLGSIVEHGPTEKLFESPTHPYTKTLLSAIPHIGGTPQKHITLEGEIPSPMNPPKGCTFHTRCPYATDICKTKTPELRPYNHRLVSCHRVEEISKQGGH
jgi:oligopeptide/dipeptide ABC transporter ATP-binding protein